MPGALPVIDVSPLATGRGDPRAAAGAIDAACRELGFFYAVGHGVEEAELSRLERASRAFFARSPEQKARIGMERGGRAWRGYFPVGGELTSGKPDQKEGIYFGAELDESHPRVRAATPLHGPNLFPDAAERGDGAEDLRLAVPAHLAAMCGLGDAILEGMARGLGLAPGYFRARYTADPTLLFRIFHYPPLPPAAGDLWSVGEHTDYGLLTLLWQTGPGLEVRVGSRWIDAPPLPGAFVCNLGDMLERMTGGLYRSTPHRVRNRSGAGRLSFAFFLDPAWDAVVRPIEGTPAAAPDSASRWDGVDVHAYEGSYGDYLLRKVEKVFPALGRTALRGGADPDAR